MLIYMTELIIIMIIIIASVKSSVLYLYKIGLGYWRPGYIAVFRLSECHTLFPMFVFCVLSMCVCTSGSGDSGTQVARQKR